ncbi:MAG TPA: hypothetical protein DIS82_09435 [Exiguobacterium sp.]|uniref:hypothetical protein n=1 Tax=Exiguobacterium sp. TaxID=44751 RepID=UPI000ED343B5|nr:hypothetical protein [Exiguobacterium sp.]HCN58370.1 hypothetical protein [Exiguobacterium sp.]
MKSSGIVSSNISYIQLAFNSLHTDVLTQERLIDYLMMIWDSGRGCSKEDAIRQVNVALNAKSPSIVSTDGLIKRWNNPLDEFDNLESDLRKNREPILMTPVLQKEVSTLYRDSRFIVLNGKSGNKDAQYLILSEWQLLNDLVHRYMFNNMSKNIRIQDVIKLVKTHYGVDEANVLFFPKVDSRFKVIHRKISLNDYENPPLEYKVTASKEILKEIEQQKGTIIEYLKRNREIQIKIREVIQKYFQKQPYENIFSAYYEGICRVLGDNKNIVISRNTFLYDDSKPESADIIRKGKAGVDITKQLPVLEQRRSGEAIEDVVNTRARSENKRVTIRMSTFERKKSLFNVPTQLLKYFNNEELKVEIDNKPIMLKLNEKKQAGSNSFGDLLFEYRVKPGQKLIFENFHNGKADLVIEPYVQYDKVEAKRLDEIINADRTIDHPSARSVLINYLVEKIDAVSISELIQVAKKHYPFSSKTIESILYKYPYFIQESAGKWKFAFEYWNGRYEENETYNVNEDLLNIWNELLPVIYKDSIFPAPHFLPEKACDARVVLWGGQFPMNRNQENSLMNDGILISHQTFDEKINVKEFLDLTTTIYDAGKSNSSTRLTIDQKITRFFLLSGIKTSIFSVPTFPVLRLPNRLKGTKLVKSILSGTHPDSEQLAPLLLEQYRIMVRYFKQSKTHVVILNFDETEYAYFLYAMLGFSEPISRKNLFDLLEERQMPIREEKQIVWHLDKCEIPFFNIGNVAFERNYQIAGELFKRFDGERWKTVKQNEILIM